MHPFVCITTCDIDDGIMTCDKGRMQLRDWLRSQKKTPDEFAAEIGVSRATIFRYMRGVTFPEMERIATIRTKTDGRVTASDWEALFERTQGNVPAVA